MRRLKTNRSLIFTLFLAALVGLGSAAFTPAQALDITGTLTADNFYVLYTGQADGSGLTRVGRNENTNNGNPGTYNWSVAETWNFTTQPGDYLYVVAWDDQTVNQMWIGQFNFTGGQLLSNTTTWEYYVSQNANPLNGDVSDATVQGEIATAIWNQPLASAPNGTSPWGTIAGIDNAAQFLWHDTVSGNDSSSDPHYVIFRTTAPVPLPPSVLLLGSGLVALVTRWQLRSRRNS